jgi:hypothetical protein
MAKESRVWIWVKWQALWQQLATSPNGIPRVLSCVIEMIPFEKTGDQ